MAPEGLEIGIRGRFCDEIQLIDFKKLTLIFNKQIMKKIS
jgi:hypothetical protein